MRVVDHFRYCPKCGQTSIAPASDKSVICSSCGLHLFANTAAAVGAIISDSEGKLLFLRRALEPRKGKLAAPGGFVDNGESLEGALKRETLEEVNLKIVKAQYLISAPNEYQYKGVTYCTTDMYFVCTVESLAPLKALDEVASVVFLDPRTVDPEDLAFPSLRLAIRHYAQHGGWESGTRDQRSEIRDQRSEIRDQRSEIRDQRSEIRDQRSEAKKPEVRGQINPDL